MGEDSRRRAHQRYIETMTRIVVGIVLFASALGGGALAQDAATNALRDAARAQERQAESLRRIEQVQRDRARDEDRARRNAARDARSLRRFDFIR